MKDSAAAASADGSTIGLPRHSTAGLESAAAVALPPSHVRQWTLPNGLTVLVQEDHSAPVASVQVWCATGSIDEDEHLGAGLSHLLEHMLFKGTKTRPANAIAQAVQNVGGYINAYTSFDRTVYWIDVPAAGVETALEILGDAVMNSVLPEDEFVKEQEVIRREFAMGFDDPDRMAAQLMFATAYQQHPYRLPVIGHLDIFNQLTHADLVRYYRARYIPNNLTFVIVGDVDSAKVYAQLTDFFAPYPGRSLRPVFRPAEPLQLGRRDVHEEFVTELTRLSFAWHIPEVTHPDVPALDVLATVLGEGRSSRLYRKVREETGLAHSVAAYAYTPGEPGLFGMEAIVDPENRHAVEELMLTIVKEIQRDGVTGEELAKVKKIALSHHLNQLTTMRGQASDLGSNWFFTRNLHFSADYLEALQKVTTADVQRAAAVYLTDTNLTVTSLNPKGSVGASARISEEVAAGEITKFELSNGLRVLVREDRRLPLVSLTAVFRGGLLAETAATNGITQLLSRVLLKGTTTRTAEEIADQLESVGGSIHSDAGNNSFTIAAEVTKPDLALGLDIFADVLLNATLPEKAIAREKEVQLARIKEEEERMTVVARNLMREALFGDHPYALRGKGRPEALAGLTREDLRRFRNQYLVAKNGVLAVFGDVTSSELRPVLEKAFAAMPAGELALEKPPLPRPVRARQAVETERDKAQAVLTVGFRGVEMKHSDRNALDLINEACSDLASRFFIRIREEMGLAYFVGSTQFHGFAPGAFCFYLGTDPQKLASVQAALLEEIEKLAQGGLGEDELARAKKKLIGQQQIANQSNITFAYATALDELYGVGFDHYKVLEEEVGALTAEEIRRVATKYFKEQHPVIAIVRPPNRGHLQGEEKNA